jgi:hypothetical protein
MDDFSSSRMQSGCDVVVQQRKSLTAGDKVRKKRGVFVFVKISAMSIAPQSFNSPNLRLASSPSVANLHVKHAPECLLTFWFVI